MNQFVDTEDTRKGLLRTVPQDSSCGGLLEKRVPSESIAQPQRTLMGHFPLHRFEGQLRLLRRSGTRVEIELV